MTYFLGIDPGKTGAIALLNPVGECIALHDMPSNIIETVKLIQSLPKVKRGAIEQPFPGGKMGKPSCMSFGMGIGEMRGILAALGIPFLMVKPQDWQRVFSVTGKSRGNDSIGQCVKLYPDVPLIEKGKRKDGRSDALLIARWLWLQERAR
jgi:crossover junction endodeoxyribonuclease RuvC